MEVKLMIFLISGSSHTGKTVLAQEILEKYQIPYLSIDHLKMGLIRSGYSDLTPINDNNELTNYLWPVLREIMKTAIENQQNLTIEGIYIPFDFQKDFESSYLQHIEFTCLIFNETYIQNHWSDIIKYENVIENRKSTEDISIDEFIKENQYNKQMCEKYHLDYLLVDRNYQTDTAKFLKKRRTFI